MKFDLEIEMGSILRKYITRGGFIKDRNGRWCKEGDKIAYSTSIGAKKATLSFSGMNEFCAETESFGVYFGFISSDFELIEPCEPDICKDFEEE